MNIGAQEKRGQQACERCLRRGWLLSMLSSGFEYHCRDRARLIDLLALPDEELIDAVGGSRRAELRARHARFRPTGLDAPNGIETVCRHRPCFPRALDGTASAPPMLNVAGGTERLAALTSSPVVAIVGSTRATDYGIEMAQSLARGLAAAGLTVTSGLADGIASAAHRGAKEVGGRTLAVVAGGLDVACPARWRRLLERVTRDGCAVSELPCGVSTQLWGQAAAERIVAALAALTVVVEANESAYELGCAHAAQALGKTVAALPGRVTSPASSGTLALLLGGAPLVRGPEDALELLSCMGVPRTTSKQQTSHGLHPTLRTTLERVGAGCDTPDKLAACSDDPREVLMALTELELMGMVARGDGGRFVARDAHAARTRDRRSG